MAELTVADIRKTVERLKSCCPKKEYYSLPMRDDIRLSVNGVVVIPGFGFMHPKSFKMIAGNAAYRELLRRPRIVTEYD